MAVASQPAKAPSGRPAAALHSRVLQRKCAICGKENAPEGCETCKRATLQRRASGTGFGISGGTATGFAGLPLPIANRVSHALGQSGRALDTGVRQVMEQRFATSFADVRVHDDAASHGASRVLGAEAFALGQHIHFGPGRYRPANRDGLGLIAHELAHTIQQRSMADSGSRDIELGAADSPLEREADRAAENAVAGLPVDLRHTSSAAFIQRKGSPEVAEISDLLSYGLFDWAITDAEAIEALTKLKGLPRIQQAEFMSDPKFAGRLRDNLPKERQAELDAIEADVKGMLPAASTVDAIIDKLSYGVVDWAITDEEAVEALDLLKTLSGEPLAIALKRIDHARLMDNLPEDRQQELIDLLAAGLGSTGTFETSESKEPGTALRSLDFVSDHAVMRDNSKDWSNEGTAFPQPDWAINKKGKTRSSSISHTMGRQMEIDLGFDVWPATADTATATITGKGSSPFLDFDVTKTMSGGIGKTQHMTSANKLPNEVAAFPDQSIDWKIKWGSWEHPIGTTGPFDIYATVDKPMKPGAVTTKRMAKAVEMVSVAPTLDPHDVVKDVMSTWTEFNLDVKYPDNEWDLAADMETGAQCIDIVRFVQSVIGTVGLPGLAEAVIIWAQPTAPTTAVETPWGDRGGMDPRLGLFPGFPGQPSWTAWLLDGNFRPNNYEAALKLTHGGKTKYYPGGVSAVFDNPDDVLTVFNCLAWIRVTGRDRYEIANVPGDYQAGLCKVGESHSFSGN
jgi:Domain of unknown function (DUF4157)